MGSERSQKAQNEREVFTIGIREIVLTGRIMMLYRNYFALSGRSPSFSANDGLTDRPTNTV
ncbi:MAG: hypothetical protein WBA76_16720 [Phormidesmis sp.]